MLGFIMYSKLAKDIPWISISSIDWVWVVLEESDAQHIKTNEEPKVVKVRKKRKRKAK